jgi:hydroxymethylbilane synthase
MAEPTPPLLLLRMGTRGSALARWQTDFVAAQLRAAWPGLRIEIVVLHTQGDRVLDKPLPLIGGKGLFTAELEEALHAEEIDLAVHSLKDLPTETPGGLLVAAIPKRADARDVLITRGETSLADLPRGAVIATGSPRRRQELLRVRPDLVCADIRGNIDTRLRRLEEHADWHGLVLAAAGLERLRPPSDGFTITPLSPDEMLPAPGQGALGIEIRADDELVQSLMAPFNHHATRCCVETERAFLRGLGGGCELPLGALAVHEDGKITFRARLHEASGCREFGGVWPLADAAERAFELARLARDRG